MNETIHTKYLLIVWSINPSSGKSSLSAKPVILILVVKLSIQKQVLWIKCNYLLQTISTITTSKETQN